MNKFLITILLILCCTVPVLADEEADIEIGLPGDITVDVDDPLPEEVILVGVNDDLLDSLKFNEELLDDIKVQNNTIICLLSLVTVSVICNGVIAFTRKGKGN